MNTTILHKALSLKRKATTKTEAEFVAYLAKTLPITMIDEAGNLHVDIRTPNAKTLFTAHTDTVHRQEGENTYTEKDSILYADPNSCLGADDGAGIAILCHMIQNQVPGYYIFFRGEECGGIGSKWLANNMPTLLLQFDRAIAFDRAGTADVITHQGCGRCCSDEFAQNLAEALTTQNYWYLPDDTGVYTDTAEFIYLIPECTNISVGYKNQHGDKETLDLVYLQRLAEQVLKVQWETLPVKRVPAPPAALGRRSSTDSWLSAQDWYLAHKGFSAAYDPTDAIQSDWAYDTIDLIENALDGSFGDLLDAIGESVYPDDPAMASRKINPHLLTEDKLLDALDQLRQGEDLDDIFSRLYDIGTTL